MKSLLAIVLLAATLLGGLALKQRWQGAADPTAAPAQAAPAQSTLTAPSLANEKPAPARGPVAPDIVSDTWLNSAPLSSADLRGKVVLVEFWTFDCINCRHTIPQLETWYQKYHDQGLVIIGVHSPEFSYEHDVANVKQAIQELKIPYAVALDNNFKMWNAFNVWAWPTVFILDKQGTIRFTHIGEGAYAEAEQTISELLKE